MSQRYENVIMCFTGICMQLTPALLVLFREEETYFNKTKGKMHDDYWMQAQLEWSACKGWGRVKHFVVTGLKI